MTISLLVKLLLVLVFVPIAYGATWAAQRHLPTNHSVRLFLERHGVKKVARYSLFALYALGGILLTVIYS
jgi:hypothetical protein